MDVLRSELSSRCSRTAAISGARPSITRSFAGLRRAASLLSNNGAKCPRGSMRRSPRWRGSSRDQRTGRNLPLLKDTAWDAAPQPDEVLASCASRCATVRSRLRATCRSRRSDFGADGERTFHLSRTERGSDVRRAVGQRVLRDSWTGTADFMIFDAGRPSPITSLRMRSRLCRTSCGWMAGEPWSIQRLQYAAGQWRDYFRSTRAHNTVESRRMISPSLEQFSRGEARGSHSASIRC